MSFGGSFERLVFDAVDVHFDVATSVLRLLLRCRPATIPRLIITINVIALDGHSLWRDAHIGEEIGERFKPALADLDPAPAVVWVGFVLRVQAPLFHRLVFAVGRVG